MKTDKPNPGHNPAAAGAPADIIVGGLADHSLPMNTRFERGAAAMVTDASGVEVPGVGVQWSVSTSPSTFEIVVEQDYPLTCKLFGDAGAYYGDNYSVTVKAFLASDPTIYGLEEFEVKTLESEDPHPQIKIEPASPPHGSIYPIGDVPLAVKVTGIPAEDESNYLVRYTAGMGAPLATGTVFPDYPSSTRANAPGDVTLAAVLMRIGTEVARTYFTYTVVGARKDSSATPEKHKK